MPAAAPLQTAGSWGEDVRAIRVCGGLRRLEPSASGSRLQSGYGKVGNVQELWRCRVPFVPVSRLAKSEAQKLTTAARTLRSQAFLNPAWAWMHPGPERPHFLKL